MLRCKEYTIFICLFLHFEGMDKNTLIDAFFFIYFIYKEYIIIMQDELVNKSFLNFHLISIDYKCNIKMNITLVIKEGGQYDTFI